MELGWSRRPGQVREPFSSSASNRTAAWLILAHTGATDLQERVDQASSDRLPCTSPDGPFASRWLSDKNVPRLSVTLKRRLDPLRVVHRQEPRHLGGPANRSPTDQASPAMVLHTACSGDVSVPVSVPSSSWSSASADKRLWCTRRHSCPCCLQHLLSWTPGWLLRWPPSPCPAHCPGRVSPLIHGRDQWALRPHPYRETGP